MNSYKLIDKKNNPSLGFEAERYSLDEYNSEHIHLKNNSKELVFMVMFRTIPEDSSGVAHILEHTTLCGSEKFKVRDPFFMMLRRSMSTFMNAFTASDWTAYPFATQSKKDFYNLLDVYLDAVYFPLLEKQDFQQEGHRLEFSKFDKSSSDLEYKGVVFNEMKGSMSNITNTTWQALTRNLFPDLTYRHNSGGEPEDITSLTHENLKGFHQKFYHPSNATYFTWGDLDAKEIQSYIDKKLTKKFKKIAEKNIEVVGEQKPFTKSVSANEFFNPVSKEQSGHQNYTAWVLGESFDINQLLEAHLISLLLMDNSSSPLYGALETNDISKSPAQILGLEDSMRHLVFICGVEGTEENSQDKFKKLLDKTFKEIIKNGFSDEQISAALYQLELSRREISSNQLPYGLQILLSMAPGALYKANPLELSNVDEALINLRENVKKDGYLTDLVEKFFVSNKHRVDLEMVPDAELINKKEGELKKILDNIKSSMSNKEKLDLVNESKELADRQNAIPNKEVLPKLELNDVPKNINFPKTKNLTTFGYSPTFYEQPTNGLTYNSVTKDLTVESQDELNSLMILSALLGKVAAGDKDHLQLQQEISRVSGGISVSNHFFYDKNEELKGKTTLTSKFLPENTTDTTNLMFEVLNKTDFSHHERIKELMFQNFMGFQQSIVENGHRFAMLGASASHNKLSHVQESLGGLSAISKFAPFVTQQDELMKTEIEKVEGMYKKFESMKSELLFISNNKLSKDQINAIRAIDFKKDGSSKVDIEFTKTFNKVAFPINTQVNFSAMSLDAPLYDVKDSPKFLILSSLMRNEFLHKRVREQGGAYGGGASYDPFTGTFKFFSYRDPRFVETIEDFQSALSWASLGSFDEDMILESKLSVLSDIDKPSSPAGEAFKDYRLSGEDKTQKMREEYRKNIFSVSKEDLVEAANSLKTKPYSVFSIINPNLEKTAEEHDFLIKRI
jgi:Zn-dependent M16 (insulinase) family peptidase